MFHPNAGIELQTADDSNTGLAKRRLRYVDCLKIREAIVSYAVLYVVLESGELVGRFAVDGLGQLVQPTRAAVLRQILQGMPVIQTGDPAHSIGRIRRRQTELLLQGARMRSVVQQIAV